MGTIGQTIGRQLLLLFLTATLAQGGNERFMDNGNGTVTDSLTALVWLKKANCTDTLGGVSSANFTWANAFTWSNSLATGFCGLTDNSDPGHWRLPTITELQSMGPVWPKDIPFTGVRGYYWSSDSCPDGTCGKALNMGTGGTYNFDKITGWAYILPVSGGRILTITKAGPGGGTVTLDPGMYVTWSGSTGTAGYANNTLVTLTASGNSASSFGGWSGAGCSGTQACFVTMDADKSVTATFNALSNARTGGTPYGTLGDAYKSVANGAIIEAKALVFKEDLTLNEGRDFTLKGGFNDDYSSQSGYAILDGVLSIDSGSMGVDRLVIGYADSSPF